MATDATTAMTIDFLRARLLSERSVSRAAKERADQLARRVAELEEQLRAVTAQRRKAERAAVEVLAILDSQGFGRLSDATDESASDGEADDGGPGAAETGRCGVNARRDAPEDALSGSEMGGQVAAAQAGGLSWKGRAAGHEGERRRPPPQQQKGRQLRQRQGHGHRRVHFYTRAADSSPKYHPGQSCRKIKRKELRSQTVSEEDVAGESAEEGQERSDCTVCTDERPDLNGEAGQDGQGSSSNERVDDVGDCYMIDCGRDGEMERVLEKQAELIGQYEAEENAQGEWEKKFRENRDSTADNVNLAYKGNEMENDSCKRETAQITDEEVVCEQARSSEKILFVSNKLSENQPKGVVAGACNNLKKSVPSPKGRFSSSLNAGHNKGQGDRNSDSDSSYNANARSSEHCKYMPSVESPSSDTPKSEISEWSSSCFHNHTDNQFDALLYQSTRNNDVEGVLEALQHAKMSLRKNLCRSSPPSQNLLALPAPEDRLREDDLPVNQMQLSLIRSAPPSQEILALQAPAYYLNRIAPDDTKVPVGHAGLFRVPTDSFPTNWMASSDGYGSRFSLTGTTQLNTSPSYAVNLMRSNSTSQYSSGYHPYSSMMPPVPTAGRRSMPEPDFRIWGSSFLPEIRRHWSDL